MPDIVLVYNFYAVFTTSSSVTCLLFCKLGKSILMRLSNLSKTV